MRFGDFLRNKWALFEHLKVEKSKTAFISPPFISQKKGSNNHRSLDLDLPQKITSGSALEVYEIDISPAGRNHCCNSDISPLKKNNKASLCIELN